MENDFILIVLAEDSDPESDRFVETFLGEVGSQFVECEVLAEKG